MKNLRHLCAAAALILTLAFSTLAGVIEIGIASPPPTPTSATGIIETGVASTSSQPAAPSLAETVLSLLQSLLLLK
ncbi:MAG: hypothetical protein ABR577_02340 [Pyrinomonadaceae bacterium]